VSVLEPEEVRQLKLFAWFLFLVDACIVGIGVLMARSLEDARGASIAVTTVAALVNGAFAAIVGVDVARVALGRLRDRRGGAPGRHGERDG
jgi:hypothetical protein